MSDMSDEAIIGYIAGRLVEALKNARLEHIDEKDEEDLKEAFNGLCDTVKSVARLSVTRVNAWEEVKEEKIKNL